ncbi:MAG: undecaprenyldiphospho-muramoylpentapeptide beta-N-acetylglucosaminyltransferase [Actinobacteria bacterium]|nr:undecaprenyldiphospho-muramoylpentapeptide beta-N-acetylglucosaminyltransferase [Actinomycetota bacterium]
MRFVIAGGGTAGHVLPAVALARELRSRGHEVRFVGTERGVEAALVPAAGFQLAVAPALPFVRKLSPVALRAPLTAIRAVRRCRQLVRGAAAVVGMGGYVSVPAVLAAARERVPVVLHEQNAVPGLANRALSRIAKAVALSFQDARRSFGRRGLLIRVTGNPVREEILRVPEERELLAKEAAVQLGLDPARRTVVVFGGSQGALRLNSAALGACRILPAGEGLQMLLLAGRAHADRVTREAPAPGSGIPLRIEAYLNRMELAYAVADLVVCRAGATTVAEVAACGLPAVLVPYPFATGRHQEANARALERAGGAIVLRDEDVSGEALATCVSALTGDPYRLGAMARGSLSAGRRDAGPALADLVEEVGRAGR